MHPGRDARHDQPAHASRSAPLGRRRAVVGAADRGAHALARRLADDDSDGGADATAACRPANAPDKITIAYQVIPNGDLVVKHEGWLEEAFPDTEIEWKLFDSGGSVNEADRRRQRRLRPRRHQPRLAGHLAPASSTRCRGSTT